MNRSRRAIGASAQPRVHGATLPDRPRVRVLVVDDDPQALVLIEMALFNAAFQPAIDVVPTVAAGLGGVADDRHDIYLIDQQLPDGTGVELIRIAKERGAGKPFILMTGFGSGALDEAALREGAADYVEKHLVGAQLERSIRYALRDWQTNRLLQDRDEQLRHAQKMQAIGRLASGVAHDFNNLLTAIIGYTDLIGERVNPLEQTAHDVAAIRKAADHAASLTRQLLAFSRKQFLSPKVLDLNAALAELIRMLPRVLGDNIRIVPRLAPDLARVKADTGHIEQVLLNIALNARDAMPRGGQLTVHTRNVTLDDQSRDAAHLQLAPGAYVMLAVTDTGSGMDAATQAQAFEPFFTTKPMGRGAGLGLATVHGIVEQNGGGTTLDTTPGVGTTIRLYLPATLERETSAATTAASTHAGTETLLLVEDNELLRDLACRALRGRGYTVYEARNAEEALALYLRSGITPALLVTDVMMPGLSGPTLAARLAQEHSQMRVLYMSGYTDDTIATEAAAWSGQPFLQKPFTPSMLAESVRLALGSRAIGS